MLRYLTDIKNWFKDPFRNRPNWSEITILCLTIAIVVIYLGQLREMRGAGQQTADLITAAKIQAKAATDIARSAGEFTRSADEMKRQSQIAVEEFRKAAAQSAQASQTAANNAEANIRNAQESFRRDQRAWIGVSNQLVEELRAKKFLADIEFFNSGKTPARREQRSLSLMLRPPPLLDEPDAEGIRTIHLYGNGVLAPQGKMSMSTMSGGDPQSNRTMTKMIVESYPAIDAGTQILYVFGEVRYCDVNDRAHTTKYCMFAVKVRETPPAWGLSYCNKFNEMD